MSSIDIQAILPGKTVQGILLADAFNSLAKAKEDPAYLAVAYAQIDNPNFNETTQDPNTGNNLLHQAEVTMDHGVIDAVKKALKDKWDREKIKGLDQNINETNRANRDGIFTTGEVAKICGVAARTVSVWFDKGELEGYRVPGSKDRRIPRDSLIKFMKGHGIPLDLSAKTKLDEKSAPSPREILLEQVNRAGKKPGDLWKLDLL